MHDDEHERASEANLMARAAWHYYVEGLTQERISELLGVGRIKVQRVLSAARDDGIVQFKIRNSIVDCLELQVALKQRFGLEEAYVVPRAADIRNIPALIGHAAGEYLSGRFNSGDVVAVGWGRTLMAAISQVPRRNLSRAVVVSMLGGLAHSTPFNPAGTAVELAGRLSAECYVLPVPVFADRAEDQRVFMSQRSIQDVLHWARRANIAILSVGSFSRENPIADFGFIRPHEWDELEAAGAVGDILGHFIDADGKLVAHPVNDRACSFPVRDLGTLPNIILVSGGRDKVPALKAALNFTRVSTLITDEDAAIGLLSK